MTDVETKQANGGEAILDPFGLLAAVELDIIPSLKLAFEKLCICQSTLDELLRCELRFRHPEAGYLSVADGAPRFWGTDPEYLERRRSVVLKAIQQVRDSGLIEVIGKSPQRIERPEVDASLGAIGRMEALFIDPVAEVKVRNGKLVCLDGTTRALAKGLGGIPAVGLQAVITSLFSNKKIALSIRHDILRQMLVWGFRFVVIDHGILLEAVLRAASGGGERSELIFFESLRDPNHVPEGLMRVGAAFLSKLWIDTLPAEIKTRWTRQILNSISRTLTMGQLLVLRDSAVRGISYLLPLNQKACKDSVDEWLAWFYGSLGNPK